MRATRFRLRSGCLSWAKKDGTVAKNQRILDVIPAQYKDPAVNSTKGWRDLTKAEIKRVNAGAMKKPQLGPKDKRAADAAKKRDELQGRTDSVEEGGQSEREELIKEEADEENVNISEIRSSVEEATISIPRPSATIKQEEVTNVAGGQTYRQNPRKRLFEEDPGYSRDMEDDSDSDFRPSKRRRTHKLPRKSQSTGSSTRFAPHKLPKVRKPRHCDLRAPEPKHRAQQPALFPSPSHQHEQQSSRSYTVHSRDALGAAMPPEPPFDGGHSQAYHSRVSNEDEDFNAWLRSKAPEDFDEWFRSEMQETQTYEYYDQDSLHNDYLQQSVPHQDEGFAQDSGSACFHQGFAGVPSQGRGLRISHTVQFPPGAQYANFRSETQLESLPDSFPQQDYSQYDYPQRGPAHEDFEQNDFCDEDFTQTGFPQNNGFLGGSKQEISQQGWSSQYESGGYQW